MVVETRSDVGAGVTVTVDAGGVATLLIDQPGRKVNVMNVAFIEELEEAVNGLAPNLKGLVVTSGKEGQFVAGADLDQVLEAAGPRQAAELIRRLHRTLNRLASLPYPSVAAINGPALGGGLELALACDYRVAVESRENILGLPEVQLGLLPAGGGTQRLPRLIGLSRALGLILEGRRYSPRRAKKLGVIDEVVHPAVLMPAARAWLGKGKRKAHPRWSRLDEAATRWSPVRILIYRQAERDVRRKTGRHYPAPFEALGTIRTGLEQGIDPGLEAEAAAFGELATGPVGRNLIGLFHATEALKREQRALSAQAATVERVGIVGAGFMGAGIAQVGAVGGYAVRVRDVTPEQVARGIRTAQDLTQSAARKGRFTRTEAREIVSRLSGTTDWSGFRRAQLVIEAVFEDVAVKRQVIADLEEILPPEAVIASNTSSLPIGSLAAGGAHPERIVGMHFFSPVHRMPLLEVVRAEATSEQAVATAVEAGRTMGKTVIVVRDGPGFYTTRVLGFMIQEAGHLFEQGASIESIDRAMTDFGFPVGPLALTDEVGIDVAAHVSHILREAFGERFAASGSIKRLIQAGRLGRKSKAGFYDYSGKKKKPAPEVYALRTAGSQSPNRGASAAHTPKDLIQRRLVLAFINEAARCLEEGIIASARDGDVGAILGVGFPPFLGGPFRYADSLGAPAIVEQLRQMEYAYGPRFTPAPMLERMAKDDERFH